MTKPAVLEVEWGAAEAWLRSLADRHGFDTIVGVSRAGLPLAVGLSYLMPQAALAILSRRGPRGEKPPYYNFETDREQRVRSLHDTFELTSLPEGASKILVMDDVATYGDTLFTALQKVRAAAPGAQVTAACYAADEGRLRAARPDLLDGLIYGIAIDNARTWVSFPWNLEPSVR